MNLRELTNKLFGNKQNEIIEEKDSNDYLCGSARPEITEELNKLDSVQLTFDQVEQLHNYIFRGKVISKELGNIAKLPNKVYRLNYAERERLKGIFSDNLEYYEKKEYTKLNKLYEETGAPIYKVLADALLWH